jgi:hypothetical protein
MDRQKTKQKRSNIEIETKEIPEVETETPHPGTEEFSLQNDSFATGENEYLREYKTADEI